VALGAQKFGKFDPEHLVKIEPHSRLGLLSTGRDDLRMLDGCLGKFQRRPNVLAGQFGVTSQQRIPSFSRSQLVENDGYGNPCPLDYWRAATAAGIDLNSLEHQFSLVMENWPSDLSKPRLKFHLNVMLFPAKASEGQCRQL
jgi:hypothetical protein